MKKKGLLPGAHFSVAGGLHNALYEAREYGCDAAQIFTKNSQTWRESDLHGADIEKFISAQEETGIKAIASHTSYLINLASPDKKKNAMSKRALETELLRSSALNIPHVVLHPGSHMKDGVKNGMLRIADNINSIFEGHPEITAMLLLETTAGQGTGLGHTFEQIAEMMESVEASERIGVCLDTCHIFAAGYDLRTENTYLKTVGLFDETIGIRNLKLIHMNDSKKELGSRVDRHAHIGKGFIGTDGFKYILNDARLYGIPKILETPKFEGDQDMDRINLELLRSL